VVWLPIYVIFFVLIADVSLMFHGQATATRIAYDGNRQASLGALETEQAVETAILARVQALSPNATVDTVFGTDTVTTTLTMPARDLLAIGSFAQFIDLDITVSSVHMLEV
nr:hypothetical protein [Paracoccaceae bacterium]